MNYLAHAYLSFSNSDVLVGNMISDHVKGKRKFDYPKLIQAGIQLHRFIDSYTDDHPINKEARQVFRPAYRLYSGAFVDVVYDHFLALDKNEFPGEELFSFSQQVYVSLERHSQWMPEGFSRMFPYMREHNWLYHYRERSGMQRSFAGVVRRAKYLTEADTAFNLFNLHYQLLHDCYRQFWQDLKPFAFDQFQKLTEAAR